MKLFKQAAKYGPVIAVAAAAGNAMAALPAGATTALSTLNTDAGSLVDLMWPVVLTVAGGFALVSLVKKAIGRSV